MTVYHLGGLDLARVDGSEWRNIFTYPDGYEPATFGPQVTWLSDSSGFVIYHLPGSGGEFLFGRTLAHSRSPANHSPGFR